ncbi:hypothetical protein B0H17DRAFT_1123696 [Mycena rosella]|uniref:Uncharacterized protein n=1 Tax=Mycena rosella TaxID=1033263 RepID=A0AAD7H260_MYCRO|nr:hypothetical protein B0H17DRAFT_1123696 [Mycena rosella]
MSAGVLDALSAQARSCLASLMTLASLLRYTIEHAPHAISATAHMLLSFEALVAVSLVSFAALAVLLIWPILFEDEYDDIESGLYYDGRDGRWVDVVPVIVVEGCFQSIRGSDRTSRAESPNYAFRITLPRITTVTERAAGGSGTSLYNRAEMYI